MSGHKPRFSLTKHNRFSASSAFVILCFGCHSKTDRQRLMPFSLKQSIGCFISVALISSNKRSWIETSHNAGQVPFPSVPSGRGLNWKTPAGMFCANRPLSLANLESQQRSNLTQSPSETNELTAYPTRVSDSLRMSNWGGSQADTQWKGKHLENSSSSSCSGVAGAYSS